MTSLRTFSFAALTTLTLSIALPACDAVDVEPADTAAADASERGPLGKADKAGSCMTDEADFCGGASVDGCWCDEGCVDYGDCCSDVDEACGVEEPEPVCPDPEDPLVNYISQEPGECAAILFACDPGQTGFTDDCGCGCIGEPAPEPEPDPACPDPSDPAVHYISTDFLHCAAIFFQCQEGQELFSEACGCGCIDL